MSVSRRRLLGGAGLLGAGAITPGLLTSLLAGAAEAQTADYKALVCIYLNGGCDTLNFVTPWDSGSYGEYQRLRQGLALPYAQLHAVAAQNQSDHGSKRVAFHPDLAGVADLFRAGKASILGSVGPTPAPVRNTGRQTGGGAAGIETVNGLPLPPQIGSHVDQQMEWLQQRRTGGRIGWGGLLADAVLSGNATPVLTSISTFQYSPLLAGYRSNQFTVGLDGVPEADFVDRTSRTDRLAGNAGARANLLERQIAASYESLQAGASSLERSVLPVGALGTVGPPGNNELASQLATVLRIAGGAAQAGMRRQIFYCNLGGFDTHGNQLRRMSDLFLLLNAALAWYVPTAERMGLFDKLTVFTTAEFGRNLPANGDGTDHGWAGHHLVVGGAVRGGRIFGALPTIGLDNEDFSATGQMLPKVSVDQYGATLAKWFGLSDAQIASTFPDTANWPARTLPILV